MNASRPPIDKKGWSLATLILGILSFVAAVSLFVELKTTCLNAAKYIVTLLLATLSIASSYITIRRRKKGPSTEKSGLQGIHVPSIGAVQGMLTIAVGFLAFAVDVIDSISDCLYL